MCVCCTEIARPSTDSGLAGVSSGATLAGDAETGGGDEACSASQCLQPSGEYK